MEHLWSQAATLTVDGRRTTSPQRLMRIKQIAETAAAKQPKK
jgi:hypothetical protein